MSSDASGESGQQDPSFRITSGPDRTEIEQPDTSDAREASSLPFRLLLVSDLCPESCPGDWSEGTHVRSVTPNTFSEQMAEMSPTLSLQVENTLGDTPQTWELELSFAELEAFEPVQVARQVEPTAELLDVRDLVQEVHDGAIGLDTFRERLGEMGIDVDWAEDLYQTLAGTEEPGGESASTGSHGGSEGNESLDRLMGMVDTEGGDDAPPSSTGKEKEPNGDSSDAVSALTEAVRDRGATSNIDPSAAEQLIEDINQVLRGQLHPIVHHPKLRGLEAAWRGLKFLVDRLSFRRNVELTVLPARRDDLQEAMYHQVLMPEHNREDDEVPTSLIVVDHAFGHEHRDIEQLTDLAETGKSLQTPVVTAPSPSFFGMETFDGLRKLPALRPHLQGEEYVEWKGLRKSDESQFLALSLPSFLLRRPYGDAPSEKGDIRPAEEEGLFGCGALAVGAVAAQSFAETGWPTHLTDYTLGDLPVQSGSAGASPLSALLPGSMQSELARAGFTVLSGESNRNTLHVTQSPSAHEPGTYDDPNAAAEARAEASLSCRLFAARAAHRLLEIEESLDVSRPIDALRQEVASAMASVLGVPVPDEASEEESDAEVGKQPVSVEHVTDADLPNQEVLGVRVRPPDSILASNARLGMVLRIPT